MQSVAKQQQGTKRSETSSGANVDLGSRTRLSSAVEQLPDGKPVLYVTVSFDHADLQDYVRKVQLERPRNAELPGALRAAKNVSTLEKVESLAPKALTLRNEFRRVQDNDKEIDKELREPEKAKNSGNSSQRSRIRTIEDFVDRPRDPRIVAKIRESIETADETKLKQLLANFERVIAVHVACAALADEELMFGAMLDDADLQSLEDDDSGFSASPESRP